MSVSDTTLNTRSKSTFNSGDLVCDPSQIVLRVFGHDFDRSIGGRLEDEAEFPDSEKARGCDGPTVERVAGIRGRPPVFHPTLKEIWEIGKGEGSLKDLFAVCVRG